jgi:hypothetical protein
MRCGRVAGVVLAGAGLRGAGVPRLRCWCRWLRGRCLGALRAPRGAAGSRGCGGRPLSVFPCRTGSVKAGFLDRFRETPTMGGGGWVSAVLTQPWQARRVWLAGRAEAVPAAPVLRRGHLCAGAPPRAGLGLDVDLASAGRGSAGAGRCFVRPWVMTVTPLRVNTVKDFLGSAFRGSGCPRGRLRGGEPARGGPWPPAVSGPGNTRMPDGTGLLAAGDVYGCFFSASSSSLIAVSPGSRGMISCGRSSMSASQLSWHFSLSSSVIP